MSVLRSLLQIGLLLALIVGSTVMATARHQADAMGTIELCTIYGVSTINVDADGNPTGPRVLCPECMPALAALDAGVVPAPSAPSQLTPTRFARHRAPAPTLGAPSSHLSRGPPVTV